MNTEDTRGARLHSLASDARSEAARLMGQSRTERKVEAARLNIQRAVEARRGQPMSEEHKARIAATRQAQETARKLAAPQAARAADQEPKRGPGRPRKAHAEEATDGVKRGRGRPKKQEGTTL